MKDPLGKYEFRCPVHGFITVSDWERTVIDQPAFQRLRRIRQLAWTEYVYPGALHSRFEHSLGVMHTATLLFDSIRSNSEEILKSELSYDKSGLERHLQLVRFAALLHDVGHAPFSHAAEELFPDQGNGKGKYTHEQYSAAIIRKQLRNAIEDHKANQNLDLRADAIAALVEGSAGAKEGIFWRPLLDGQMDADRMDYLLRDSHHLGVQYGRFDLPRLINTIRAIQMGEGSPRLGITKDGFHAAEALVIARYFMFTQVYFHKTRVAFDIHLRGALQELLPGGVFPSPRDEDLDQYLMWDDWRVFAYLADNKGGEHAQRLANRDHFRQIYDTPETRSPEDTEELERIKSALGSLLAAQESAEKSWYKPGRLHDIPVVDNQKRAPLSSYSKVVGNLRTNNQVLLYVRPEDVDKAKEITNGLENRK